MRREDAEQAAQGHTANYSPRLSTMRTYSFWYPLLSPCAMRGCPEYDFTAVPSAYNAFIISHKLWPQLSHEDQITIKKKHTSCRWLTWFIKFSQFCVLGSSSPQENFLDIENICTKDKARGGKIGFLQYITHNKCVLNEVSMNFHINQEWRLLDSV